MCVWGAGGEGGEKSPTFSMYVVLQAEDRKLAAQNRATFNRFSCTEGGCVINRLHKSFLCMAFKGQQVAIKGIVNCSKGKCNIYTVISHVMYNSREMTKKTFGTTAQVNEASELQNQKARPANLYDYSPFLAAQETPAKASFGLKRKKKKR